MMERSRWNGDRRDASSIGARAFASKHQTGKQLGVAVVGWWNTADSQGPRFLPLARWLSVISSCRLSS
jgi:hypothetical protein